MKDDSLYLSHILECINDIQEYTKAGRTEFTQKKIIQDAVIRNLEIIGEATKKLSRESRNLNPDIPWRDMAGLRDVLIHDYFGVDLDIVWNVVENELPHIKKRIEQMLNS